MATAAAISQVRASKSSSVHPVSMGGAGRDGPKAAVEDKEDPDATTPGDGWIIPSGNLPPPPSDKTCCTAQFVLDPRSKYIKYWEYLIMCLLLFTSTVTPFEVSFLEVDVGFLFILNRIIDCLFLKDLIMQFNLGFFEKNSQKHLITNKKEIMYRYITGWFAVDLVSIIPFDMIGFVVGSAAVSRLKILRILRLLRLFKLAKLLKSAEMINKIQSRLGFRYSMMSLCKYMMIIIFVSHWLACLWHVVTVLEDEDQITWVVAYFCDGIVAGCSPSVGALYCASLYHATMTLTTIGYGDLVAHTTTERWISIGTQLIGASLYAYIVGVASGIVASMNKEKMQFQETMDELNDFLEDQQLDSDLCARLREYFQHLRSVEKMRMYSSLLNRMSPGLRGEVANLAYGEMIQSVTYFNGVGESFITQVALTLEAMVLSSGELVVSGGTAVTHLYFVAEGLVSCKGRVEALGFYFGEDVIMSSAMHNTPVRAISYCNLYTLSREKLNSILADFPRVQKLIRRAVMKLAFQRDVLKTLKRILEEQQQTVDRESVFQSVTEVQQKLLAKDAQIKILLDESIVMQKELMGSIPKCQVFSAILMNDQKDKDELAKVVAVQEDLCNHSASSIRASLHSFWRQRRSLSHTHMILSNTSPIVSQNLQEAKNRRTSCISDSSQKSSVESSLIEKSDQEPAVDKGDAPSVGVLEQVVGDVKEDVVPTMQGNPLQELNSSPLPGHVEGSKEDAEEMSVFESGESDHEANDR